jgi:aspartate aminotransferase-like enzyme
MHSTASQKVFQVIFVASLAMASQAVAQQKQADPVLYLQLTKPRQVLSDAQPWEGKEFPHTMSVLELNHDGFRY